MKLTHSSALILAVAVAQSLAVTPIPVAGCTKQVVVDPKYDSCNEFASDYNLTFADLLKMNEKLRKDCMNLDTGEKMCVSINPGGVNPPLKKEKTAKDTKDAKEKTTKDASAAAPAKLKASDSKTIPVKKAPVVAVAAPVPAPAAPAHAPIPAAVVVPVPANTGKLDEKKDVAKDVHSSLAAAGARASFAVAAAGILLSLPYLL
ncbi:hypothetical protein EMPS_04781 [Entomortierella parvispora]|uniref:LysM domain-containing protein n=1 Tax=Entomortierella parvispora TaxID=205924 RepID=A0A9P3H992_9FUNG|nr:hypothetical protein EMPS_04781 [Entomortierella parvispora]